MEAGIKGEKGSAKSDVARLTEMFQQCYTRNNVAFSNPQQNRDARFNIWPGQTPDQRKWTPDVGDGEVLPWRGASDLRVPMIDSYVNEDVALSVLSIMRGGISASAVKTASITAGKHATNIIKWMLLNEMTEFNRETRLLANYHFERGKAVLLVLWDRQVQMGYQDLTLDMVSKMAEGAAQALAQDDQVRAAMNQPEGSAPEDLPEPLEPDQRAQLEEVAALPQLVMDENYDDRLAELMQQYAGQIVEANFAESLGEYHEDLLEDYKLKKGTAKRLVKDLREKSKACIPIPTVSRNRPVFISLAMGEDFFVPDGTGDSENARAQFWLQWLTEEQIREKVIAEGWDEDWADYVIKNGRGKSILTGAASPSCTSNGQNRTETPLETENLYGILHCFEKRCNEDGVPGIYYTVMHPTITDEVTEGKKTIQPYAMRELLNYAHGEYPSVIFRREYLSRRVDDSRGYGEIGYAWQKQVKTELDMQIDRSRLATNPPLHHPKGRPPTKWGPGVKVPGSKTEYQFADVPQWDPGSDKVIEKVTNMSDRYYGRKTQTGDPVVMDTLQQDKVNNWLDGWKLAITQMWQLMQQFMPETFYYKVVGSAQGQSIRATREEIQGKFDITVKFGVENLDYDKLKEKIEAMTKVVQMMNVNGIVDFDQMLTVSLSWIDPDLPELILKPSENASQQEADDEKNIFARMFSGVGTDVKPGQAYQLRLEVLEDCLAGKNQDGSPKNPSALTRYQQDEQFRGLVDNRRQQLQFQLAQHTEHAMAGRLGGKPNN